MKPKESPSRRAPASQQQQPSGTPARLEQRHTQPLLTFADVAGILNLAEKTLRNRLSGGRLRIPVIRLGSRVRFAPSDVIEYIAQCREVA